MKMRPWLNGMKMGNSYLIGWARISKMRYCYQTWQIHILLENEMLKNVNFIKIGPRLDMPIGRQSFATITPMWNGATNKN